MIDTNAAALPASALADHVERMIAVHGDLPLLQHDQDTGWTLRTDPDCIRPGRSAGGQPILIVSNAGYHPFDDEGPIAASRFVEELRASIAKHGDLPAHQYDQDTSWTLAIPAQRDRVADGGIVISSVDYAGCA